MKVLKIFILVLVFSSLFSTRLSYAESLKRSFAWPLEVRQLDPHNTSSDTLFSLIAHYLAPLLDISPDDNRVIPALAESWDISNDGKTITLHFRENAYWSDGTLITAQQAKQSIERALSSDTVSDAQTLLTPIEGAQERIDGQKNFPLGVQAPDRFTLIFKLMRADPDFLRVLAFPIASPIPTHQIDSSSNYPPIETLSSSGPYRLVKTAKHSADFIANEKYFGEQPQFTQVSFIFAEYKNLINGFLNVSYDTIEYIPTDQMPWLRENMPNSIEISKSNGAFYLVLKHEEQGGFDAEFRQLLLESLDYYRLNEVMTRKYFSTMSGLIPWGPPLPDPSKASLMHQREAARKLKRLVEQNGYSQEHPLEICINLHEIAVFERLLNFLGAHLRTMNIQLTQKDYNTSSSQKQPLDTRPENLCHLTLDGYGSRIKSEDEIIQAFFPGGLFYPFLENKSELHQKYTKMAKLADPKERALLSSELGNYLIDKHYVRALFKADLISLVNKQRIINYAESKSYVMIPRTQHLKPSR